MTAEDFSSQKIIRTSTITLQGSRTKVFPLFNPVKEREWAAGWDPQFLTAPAHDQDITERMVFRTPSHLGHGETEYTWVLSKYAPEQAFIEYTVFTPERLWWITIQCSDGVPDQTTIAEITYTYVGLTEKGNAINTLALQQMYADDLRDWERAINHYLMSG